MPYYLIHAGTSLQKMSTAGDISTLTLPAGVTVSSERKARFALLNKTLLIGNAPSRTLLYDGSANIHIAGLTAPTAAPTVSGGAGSLIGAYVIAYTFVIKAADGTTIAESDLSPLSASITLATQGLSLSGVEISGDYGVTTRRFYRSAAGGSTLYFDEDIDNNSATTYLSTQADAALGTTSVDDAELGSPPGTDSGSNLKLMTVWKDRIWGVSDTEPDNLRFSASRAPYAWSGFNMIPIPPVGTDEIGVNGFLPRRDELGVLKLDRLAKIVGSSADDFQMIVVAEGVGCIAPDSAVVIRDVGYFLGHDGVYCWGPEGLFSISDDQVRPWFSTDDTFNRSAFGSAFGRYNWRTHSYELHLASADQTTIDLWVQYDIARKRWFGPHLSLAMTPTCGGFVSDDNSLPIPVVGCDDGYLWAQNNTVVMDGNYEIPFDVVTQPYCEDHPDEHKLFLEMSLINKDQGGGFVAITPTVDADEQTMFLAPISQNRTRLRRLGNGRLLTVQFEHDTFEEDCEIHGFEVPFFISGRR